MRRKAIFSIAIASAFMSTLLAGGGGAVPPPPPAPGHVDLADKLESTYEHSDLKSFVALFKPGIKATELKQGMISTFSPAGLYKRWKERHLRLAKTVRAEGALDYIFVEKVTDKLANPDGPVVQECCDWIRAVKITTDSSSKITSMIILESDGPALVQTFEPNF